MHCRAAVVDDEVLYRDLISGRVASGLSARGCSCTVSTFECEDALFDAMKVKTFDIFFLDIAVREYNGIRLAEKLRKMGIVSPVIFVSAMETAVFEAFCVQPLGFIRKSELDQDFPPLLDRLADQLKYMEVQKIVLSSKNGQMVVRTSDILYIESANKVQMVHIASNIIEVKHNMSYFETNLPKEEFIRSHRCYFVNGRCIARVASDEIEMDNGDILPISRRSTREIQDLFRRLNVG